MEFSSAPVSSQMPPSPQGGPVFDPMQQNQNDGTAMSPPPPVVGVGGQTTTSIAKQQPLQQQQRAQPEIPNLCCCCELRVGLGLMAAFEVVLQTITLALFAFTASSDLRRSTSLCEDQGGNTMECDMFYVSVLFILALALMSSLVLLISTCMIQKTLSTVSHLVGWIPILSSVVYITIYEHYYDGRLDFLFALLIEVTLGLTLRFYESFVVYYYWKEIPGQYQYASQRKVTANTYGGYAKQTNYDYATTRYGGYGNGSTSSPWAAPPNAQPGDGAYGQPGGYNYGAGGYGGFGQPGYGGYAGYGGFGQPVGGYSHV